MIIPVNEQNIMDAAIIHSISWRESHRDFCTPEFIEIHSPERQLRYIRDKMDKGTRFFMLVDEAPVGVVSVTENLIEDLYVLPEKQNMGYGTELLQFAVGQCPDTPSLWILENNVNAERLYRRMGFTKTGRINAITDELAEIEMALEQTDSSFSTCFRERADVPGRRLANGRYHGQVSANGRKNELVVSWSQATSRR